MIYKQYFSKIEMGSLQADPTGEVTFAIQTPLVVKGITPDQLIISTTVSAGDLSTLLSGSSTLIVGTSSEKLEPPSH